MTESKFKISSLKRKQKETSSIRYPYELISQSHLLPSVACLKEGDLSREQQQMSLSVPRSVKLKRYILVWELSLKVNEPFKAKKSDRQKRRLGRMGYTNKRNKYELKYMPDVSIKTQTVYPD
ncbi:hypothetical protein OUZ56_033413 [Daphnia magna]|uniref:Uncharacterized protein n=1 Tax=Daphnia magna TaxID=35525 RepID=A0ABQ9ZXT2_9CRUS|nr:hypothetical protein OUZ56_033413 [Daphnia magna]